MPHSFSQIAKKFITTSIVIGVASAQLVLSAFISPATVAKAAGSSSLVISQVQFGGASANDEFVELYNLTAEPINLATFETTGLKLRIRNSAGTDENKTITFRSANTTISPNGYFLIAGSLANSSIFNVADATYSVSSGNTLVANGSVYISTSSTALENIKDMVGWGPASGINGSDYEGSPIAGFTANTQAVRMPNNTAGSGTDTGDNSADFSIVSNGAPRASVLPAPTHLVLTPGNHSITATWNPVLTATSYGFSVSPAATPPSPECPATTCSATFSSLTNGTSYLIEVYATRTSGATVVSANISDYSTPVLPTLLKPIITSIATGIEQLVVNWSAVASAENYLVHYTPAEGATQSTGLLSSATLSTTLSGLTGDTPYLITVEASAAGLASTISDAVTGTPLSPTTITINPTLIFSNNGVVGTSFGAGAQVVTTVTFDSAVSASDNPALTLTRPGAGPVQFVLTQTGANEWRTTTAFDVAAANLVVQDGVVTAAITFGSSSLSVGALTNGSFIADTTASVPTITLYQNAPGTEDALKFVTTEPETIRVYSDASLADSSLIVSATTDANNIAATTIGDNKFATLYIVAEDSVGNFTPTLVVQNDISAPVTPAPKSVNANGNITVSWQAVSGAISYIVRWRDIDPTPWSQIVTTDTSYTFTANPSAVYEVQVSAVDSAGNVSSAIDMNVTTPAAVVVATASASTANEQQLFGAMATTSFIQTDGNKDGSLSPVANTNSTPTPTPTSTSQSSSSNSSSQPQDLSKAIVILAIVLILAGIAIAAYSWYQGGEQTDSTKPKTAEEPTPKAVTPVAKPVEKVAEKPKSTKPINQPTRRGRPRRKR